MADSNDGKPPAVGAGNRLLGERFGLLLSHRAALVGALAADLAFDLVEFGDPFQGLGGGWRRQRFGNVEPTDRDRQKLRDCTPQKGWSRFGA